MIETIQKRRSVRTFLDREISEEDREKVQRFVREYQKVTGPFGHSVRLVYIDAGSNRKAERKKIGTYGVITRPQAFLGAVVLNRTEALYDCGYVFERLILHLVQIGLGTCWLGGTFDRDEFGSVAGLEENQIIPVVTPLGYPSHKGTLRDRTMRRLAGSDSRKSFSELFFAGSFDNPLYEEQAGNWGAPLEAVRLGPSASNKQPWRMVVSFEKETLHLYMKMNNNYSGNRLGFEIQRIDMGIAMAHLEESCSELGFSGRWVFGDPGLSVPDRNYHYIASWQYNGNEKE